MPKESKLQEWRKSISDRKTVLKVKRGKYLNCLPSLRYTEHMECPQRKERGALKILTLAEEIVVLDQ